MPSSEHRYGECRVAAQAIFTGDQDSRVQGVTESASLNGRPHIAVRVGRVLVYVEDRAALNAWVEAWRDAAALADDVFGVEDDAFASVDRAERARFERGGPP